MENPATHTAQGSSWSQPAGRATTFAAMRRMVVLGMAAGVFSALLVLSFGYAQHSPRPHGVRIDVVASAGAVEQVRRQLAAAVPGGFDVRQVSTEALARQHLQHMTTSGALANTAGGAVWVLTASAEGLPLQQAVDQALSGVARAQGRKVQLVDVVALPARDRAGLSAFALELGLLVPAVIGAIGLFLLGRRARVWIRVLGAVVYAVVAAALAVVMLDAVLGALTGSPWVLFGDAVIIAAAFVLSVAALHCLLGLQGTAIAAGALIVVGNAVNGTAVPTNMLPEVYRQVAPWMPNNAAVHLARSDLYFAGHNQGGPLLTLSIWLAAAVLIVLATDLIHVRLCRATPHRAPLIHATSLAAHLRASRNAVRHDARQDAESEPTTPQATTPAPLRGLVADTARAGSSAA